MKVLRLFSYFLTGATATTLGGGLSFTPYFIRVLVYAVVLGLIAIVSALAFDDPIAEYMGIELPDYYSIVWGVAITFIAGLSVLGGILWQ